MPFRSNPYIRTYFSAKCITIDTDPKWNFVETEPALPVAHGTTVTLNCLEGYTNKGGETATCQNGQVVPSNEPPDCSGELASV